MGGTGLSSPRYFQDLHPVSRYHSFGGAVWDEADAFHTSGQQVGGIMAFELLHIQETEGMGGQVDGHSHHGRVEVGHYQQGFLPPLA